jgi:uncharacterized protein DUF4268
VDLIWSVIMLPDWTNAHTPSREGWITLPFGASWAWYSLVVAGSSPRVELYFGSPEAEVNKREYERFEARRDDLETRFGGPLEFQPLPGRKACRIAVTAPHSFDVLSRDHHAELSAWFIEIPRPVPRRNSGGAPDDADQVGSRSL